MAAGYFRLGLVLGASQPNSDTGDNFAGNLFTDFAPILTLFGDQVSKQFLC